jgi:Flp pilus assembly protein TadD
VDAVRRAPEIALSDLDVSAELRARMRRHLIEQGRLDEAIASLRKAVDADPQNAAAYDHLGTLLVQQAKLDEGVGPELERGAVG